MTPDERLLEARKGIWVAQLHNLKAQVYALRIRMGSTPNELRKALIPMMEKLKESERLMNDAEFSLDESIYDAIRHQATTDPVKCPN